MPSRPREERSPPRRGRESRRTFEAPSTGKFFLVAVRVAIVVAVVVVVERLYSCREYFSRTLAERIRHPRYETVLAVTEKRRREVEGTGEGLELVSVAGPVAAAADPGVVEYIRYLWNGA